MAPIGVEYGWADAPSPAEMSTLQAAAVPPSADGAPACVLERRLRDHFSSRNLVRRGLCLLNAGQLEQAEQAFRRALEESPRPATTAAVVIALYHENRETLRAEPVAAEAVAREPEQSSLRIRHALLLHENGHHEEALDSLRAGIALSPSDPALQFHLGLLLASAEAFEEAELRFTQVLAMRKGDIEARINLALCQAATGRCIDAFKNLQQSQRLRPADARIGLLLTQAFRAAREQGAALRLPAVFPEAEEPAPEEGIAELSRIFEEDAEFLDTLLSVRLQNGDANFHALLLKTLHLALDRCPEQAELHYHCGRVLERMGQLESAIREGERAVSLDPRMTRALIDLARWYRRIRRADDARARLEQVIAAGFEYADVYCQLGELYQDEGRIEQAASAYRRALTLNADYRAARLRLESLTTGVAANPRG